MKNTLLRTLVVFSLFALVSCGAIHRHSLKTTRSFGGGFAEKPAPKEYENFGYSTTLNRTDQADIVLSDGGQSPTMLRKARISKPYWLPQQKNMGSPSSHTPQDSSKPDSLIVEPITQVAFLLSLTSGSAITLLPILQLAFGDVLFNSFTSNIWTSVYAMLFIALLAALILGIIGLGNIKKYPHKYGGYGKAMAAVVISGSILLFTLLALALYVLLVLLLLAIFV